ncbi:MAG: substrate-binding domain-containing protein [Anaerolineae bacterium]
MIKAVAPLALSAALAACGATVEPPPPLELRLSATEGAAAMLEQAGTEYHRAAAHVEVSVTAGSASRSLARLAAGQAAIALTAGLPPGSEPFRQTPVARDGAAIIVHPDNPVRALTLLELQQLYSGRILNWRQVQGSDAPVQVAVREPGSGLGAVFEARVMNGTRITPNARVFPTSRAVVQFVAQNPQAVGYVGAPLTGDGVAVVAVEEVLPRQENLTNGAYPLTYDLFALTPPDAGPDGSDFVNFLLGPAGQEIVAAHGLGRVR